MKLSGLNEFFRTLRPASAAAALALLSVGCGGGDGSRLPVSGNVVIDQKPLETGSITFLPEGEGAPAVGEIVDGKYEIGADGGPQPGAYKVVILSSKSTGKQVPSLDDPSVMIDEVVNIVPTRYNVQTTLRAEVKREGNNQFPFELTSLKETAKGKGKARSRRS
ncbi:hypothetical protein [Singulisphaera sp. PoT]|uniref:hypothetical protein n=1 Tax=Singulisphaera sp. PoT TaxID=3411797 RepID=UPI003BF56C5F